MIRTVVAVFALCFASFSNTAFASSVSIINTPGMLGLTNPAPFNTAATYNSLVEMTFSSPGDMQIMTWSRNAAADEVQLQSGEDMILERLLLRNTGTAPLTLDINFAVLQPNSASAGAFDELIVYGVLSNAVLYASPDGDPGDDINSLMDSLTLGAPGSGLDVAILDAFGTLGDGREFFIQVEAVPIPAAGVLFGSALVGFGLLRRKSVQAKLGLPS